MRFMPVPEAAAPPMAVSPDEEATFFDAIAEGSSIKAAGRLIGLTHASALTLFETFRRSLGAQGE